VQTESLANVSSAVLKEAYAAVVVVLEEAARLDVDAAAFSYVPRLSLLFLSCLREKKKVRSSRTTKFRPVVPRS